MQNEMKEIANRQRDQPLWRQGASAGGRHVWNTVRRVKPRGLLPVWLRWDVDVDSLVLVWRFEDLID